MEAEKAGIEHRGKRFDGGVIILDRRIEIPAFNANAVLRALQLCLQFLEVFRCLQIRIPLHHHQQTGQGRRKLALGLVKRRQLGRIGRCCVGIKLHLSHRRSRRGDFGERGFLEIGSAGNRRYKIGDEVGPALIDVLHLRPLAVHGL